MSLVSFIIPVRVDSEDRIQNLEAVLEYITRYFGESEIIVVEDDIETRLGNQLIKYPNIKYFHVKNEGRFSKSRTVNTGLLKATGEFVVIHDSDVLVDPAAIHKCLKIMDRGIKHIMVPYNSVVINVAGKSKEEVIGHLDLSKIKFVRTGLKSPRNSDHSYAIHEAGICIIRRSLLLNFGGFNKKMVSYGYEDVEIYARLRILGFYHFMTPGYNLIHLDHQRGVDSRINELFLENRKEYDKVKKMSYGALHQYATSDLRITEINRSEISQQLKKQRFLNVILLQPLFYFIRLLVSYLTHNRIDKTLLKIVNPKLRKKNQYKGA
jgi:GT2 family glycosyltransferase